MSAARVETSATALPAAIPVPHPAYSALQNAPHAARGWRSTGGWTCRVKRPASLACAPRWRLLARTLLAWRRAAPRARKTIWAHPRSLSPASRPRPPSPVPEESCARASGVVARAHDRIELRFVSSGNHHRRRAAAAPRPRHAARSLRRPRTDRVVARASEGARSLVPRRAPTPLARSSSPRRLEREVRVVAREVLLHARPYRPAEARVRVPRVRLRREAVVARRLPSGRTHCIGQL